jgi:hypothetical protein
MQFGYYYHRRCRPSRLFDRANLSLAISSLRQTRQVSIKIHDRVVQMFKIPIVLCNGRMEIFEHYAESWTSVQHQSEGYLPLHIGPREISDPTEHI